jgi:acetyl/propionyl-CoA carboxylase alpha subunit
MLNKVLVANRGEIARRIFRACRDLGLEHTAVYSETDAGMSWLRDAPEAVALPGATAQETFLNPAAIIAAAHEAGADSIHPGYGFLAENAEFAAMCAAESLTFVGPTPEAMRALGDKVAAKAVARSAGVPTVPGFDGDDVPQDGLADAASRLGFPILIKASAGGGGRGMRVVTSPDELSGAIEAARAEALSAFGDPRLLYERFFPRARHVEVQVIGDTQGNIVHAFERECSVQRRHQKIIEESPSPGIGRATREALTRSAVALAREAVYSSAGTVEFLVDEDGGHYLLEVNARLQVEHPVTEALTGLDLAVMQLRVAGGAELGVEQSEIVPRGHAIEARVYAEDPAHGFLPSIGRVGYFARPSGVGIRCDDGISAGDVIPGHFDSMIGKVIAHGRDRDEARSRLQRALADTVVLGVITNVPFLADVVSHPAFVAGDTLTTFVTEHMGGWRWPAPVSEEEWTAAFLWEALGRPRTGLESLALGLDPWAVADGWRNARP